MTSQTVSWAWNGGRLVVGKDTITLLTNPLVEILKKKNISAADLWGSELAEKLGCFDDGCYLSCSPSWKIENNKLFLEEIEPCCYTGNQQVGIPKVDLKKIFPDLFSDGHVLAAWYNEELLAGTGKLLYANMEGVTIYDKEIGFHIQKGVVQNTITYDNSKTKLSPFLEDNSLLKDYIPSHIQWNTIESEIDSTKKVVYCRIISTNESGTIDSVSIVRPQSEILNNEAIRVIKSIPQWEVLYRQGKQFERQWIIPVGFDTETRKKYEHQ
jgi:hypothetical protein